MFIKFHAVSSQLNTWRLRVLSSFSGLGPAGLNTYSLCCEIMGSFKSDLDL